MNDQAIKDNPEQQGSDEKVKVLFVDDEKQILVALRRLFRSSGWKIYTAESGAEGLVIIAEQAIDLVVSDMRMPNMNGAEFLEQVSIQSPSTVKVLLTGYSEIDSTIAAINKGKIFSYCSKPWDNDELRETLQRAVYSRQLEIERDRLLAITKQQNEALKSINENLEQKVEERAAVIRKAATAVKKLNRKLTDSYRNSVEVFASLVEMGRKSTSGRNKRVAEMARTLAEVCQLDEQTIEQVYYAALLSNIGKLSLPDDIARMNYSDMNTNQRNIYAKHSLVGEAVLMSVPALQVAASFIRHQSEREDGKGYPDKLAADAIPLGAKLIHIAKYYDELINDDSLSEPLSKEAIVKQLEKTVDRRFSSELVTLFIEQLESGRFTLSQKHERRITAAELEVDMTLTRDIVAANGMLLLSSGAVVKAGNIDSLKAYERELDSELSIHVLRVIDQGDDDNGNDMPDQAKAS